MSLTPDLRAFPNADQSRLAELSESIAITLEAHRAPGTTRSMQTPVFLFWKFVHLTLGTSFDKIITKRVPADWSSREHDARLAVMMAFASEVTRTHATVDSTAKYVSQVTTHFADLGFYVWSKELNLKAWRGFFKGLEVRKAYAKVAKCGFSAADVCAMNAHSWKATALNGVGAPKR